MSICTNSPIGNGLVHKLPKVHPLPVQNCRIPRHHMGHRAEYQAATQRENPKMRKSNRNHTSQSSLVVVASKSIARKSKLRDVHCSTRETTLPSDTNSGKQITHGTKAQEIPVVRTCHSRIAMVDKKHSSLIPNSPERSNNFHNDRCCKKGVGGDSGKHPIERPLEQGTDGMAQQQKRIGSSVRSNKTSGPPHAGSVSDDTIRQSLSCGLYHQTRRDTISWPASYHSKYFEPSKEIPDNLSGTLSPRKIQFVSRQPIEVERVARMVIEPKNMSTDLQFVGKTGGRLICECSISRCPPLCMRGCPRQRLSIRRCIQPVLELQDRLAVPSTSTDSARPTTPNPLLRNIPSSSTEMGKNILEGRTGSDSTSSTIQDPGPTEQSTRSENGETSTSDKRHVFAGLEGSGWNRFINSWPEDSRNLLELSWRKSTLKTYGPAWSRWRTWSRLNNVTTDDPSPENIAEFICYLHKDVKLAARSIALHKSVVTTFSNPENSERLSSHPLVKRTLKAVFSSHPPIAKPLSWEVGQLIEYLNQYDFDSNSLYQVSRHTAALLLMSGRRVHDLTLLDISPHHYETYDDHLIFWPQFGSKTDSTTYRQSGWSINSYNSQKLNAVFWVKKLITLGETRRANKITQLFITTRSKVKEASKTVISGWLRNLLEIADIKASPGSFRAAVNTDNWTNRNLNLDEVLDRGNWRSKDTFLKHYFKLIPNKAPQVNQMHLSASFIPLK